MYKLRYFRLRRKQWHQKKLMGGETEAARDKRLESRLWKSVETTCEYKYEMMRK